MTQTPRLAPVDCVRALATVSQALASSLLVSTAFLPSSGSIWRHFTDSWVFFALRGGSQQTQVFLLLSGLLLGQRLVDTLRPVSGGEALTAGARVLAARALRLGSLLLPPLVLALVPGADCVALSPKQLLLHASTFTLNFLDIRRVLGVALPFMWHACVDFQCGAVLTCSLALLRHLLPFGAWAELTPLVVAFFAVSSAVLRATSFDAKVASLTRAAERPHVGYLATTNCGEWAERVTGAGNFKWRLHMDARRRGVVAASMTTFGELQHDTFNAFGLSATANMAPMAIGVLLALMLNKQGSDEQARLDQLEAFKAAAAAKQAQLQKENAAEAGAKASKLDGAIAALEAANPRRVTHALVRWFWSAQAVFTLGVTCLPLGTWTDTPQEWLVSTAFPSLGAAAVAFLLFTALCLPTSRWHSPWLAAAMSSPLWRPLARASPAILALHFPALVALAVGVTHRQLLLPKDLSWGGVVALATASAMLSAATALPLHALVLAPLRRRASAALQKREKKD